MPLAEADAANAAASAALNRPRIVVEGTGNDITEDIVSLIDALDDSIRSGSGWLDDDEERAVERLKQLLLFRCGVQVNELTKTFWYGTRSVPVGSCGLLYKHEGDHQVVHDSDGSSTS
jgi:hypothetical protein